MLFKIIFLKINFYYLIAAKYDPLLFNLLTRFISLSKNLLVRPATKVQENLTLSPAPIITFSFQNFFDTFPVDVVGNFLIITTSSGFFKLPNFLVK